MAWYLFKHSGDLILTLHDVALTKVMNVYIPIETGMDEVRQK
jgi:hypothetical protein